MGRPVPVAAAKLRVAATRLHPRRRDRVSPPEHQESGGEAAGAAPQVEQGLALPRAHNKGGVCSKCSPHLHGLKIHRAH